MRLQVFWRLPVQGSGRRSPALADARRDGTANFDYLAQIGRAAELSHFDGLLIPYSDAGEEPLVIAGALAREIRQLSLVPSFPAQFIAPVYAAKIALSFQRLTRGRLAWNLVIDDSEKPWHGRRRSVAEQVERTGEFLEIVKGIWDGGPFDFKGKYYEVEKGGFAPALTGHKLPAIHLSGDSEAVLELSARHADVHLLALAPVEAVREKIVKLTARAGTYGRTLRFALESGIIARHSDEAA